MTGWQRHLASAALPDVTNPAPNAHQPAKGLALPIATRLTTLGIASMVLLLGAAPASAAKPPACPSTTPTSKSPSTVNIVVDSLDVTRSIWEDGTVSLSLPLENRGNTPAADVMVQNVQGPPSAVYLGPTPFPYSLGTISPDSTTRINALLSATTQQDLLKYPVIVNGTYGFGAATCTFQTHTFLTPEPQDTAGTAKAATRLRRFTAATATYPPPPPPSTESPNAESDYIPPLGPVRYLFPAPPPPSDALAAPVASDANPSSDDPNAVVFTRSSNAGAYAGLPPDPSAAGAAPNGFVMVSGNTAVSVSTDFGATFTTHALTGAGFSDPGDPTRTSFFPEDDGGLCCDQVVLYVPGRNLMVWLLLYWSPDITLTVRLSGVPISIPAKGQNRLRIAWATPEAAAADFLHAWSWFDVTPATLGDTVETDWMDRPDLAYSNEWLYISASHGTWSLSTGQKAYNNRRWFVRASLTDMVSLADFTSIRYYEAFKTGLRVAHFAQSSLDTMYYAALSNTSTLSVFADPDSGGVVPTPKDIPISSICGALFGLTVCDYSVLAPDDLNWNVTSHAVLGATYVAPSFICPPDGCSGPTRFVYFAFDAARDFDGERPFPYVRVAKIDADALTLVTEYDIWNAEFAFATPALVWRPPSAPGSGRDEVALSLARGGGRTYADNVVGFLGDDALYVTTSSNGTQTGGGEVRYGDYFHVRNATGPTTLWGQGVGYGTAAYLVTRRDSAKSCAVGGCDVELRYVMFGRRSDLFPSAPIPDPR
jgi:hypothetical protein